ncbi:MAG: cyclic pyranopterin monophosphate synthase MoaC [Clostridia bacterium]|nr:cyclic pyranopterin monophosphate synthase MoaC [Clostridia bacterium]
MDFSHLDEKGAARMVNVGEKTVTQREAVAAATVIMQPDTLQKLLNSELKKGDALQTARIAGIMAAKRTDELIPLCHNIPIESIKIEFENNGEDRLYIRATLRCSYKTGIEMEALTAASVAALTVYDMCKAIDRGMSVTDVRLVSKTGGKTDYHA